MSQITSRPQTITIAVADPRIKPALMRKFVEGLLELGQVHYIDLDLQFSSLLQNLSDEEYLEIVADRSLHLIQPSDDILDVINFVSASETMIAGGVVILDSINSLQNLVAGSSSTHDSKTTNYRSSILISVIQMISRFYLKSFLILNVTKARPKTQPDESISWEKEIVGGRMMRYKSDLILETSELKQSIGANSNPTAKFTLDREFSAKNGGEEKNVYTADL
ncbi:MAG: hypothetical protein OK439_06905 [Thaumarchaeota archaeon]|nr:hypothetical protein [Nitrososphaerota archaeon]